MKTEILPQLYNKIRYIFLVLLFPRPKNFQCFPGSFWKNHVLFTWLVHLYTYLQRTSLQKSMVFIKPWPTRRPYRNYEINGVHKTPPLRPRPPGLPFLGKVRWGGSGRLTIALPYRIGEHHFSQALAICPYRGTGTGTLQLPIFTVESSREQRDLPGRLGKPRVKSGRFRNTETQGWELYGG